MFVTGPPGTGPGLTLVRVAHRREHGAPAHTMHATPRRYVTDLAATRGLAVREDVLGAGVAYAALAEPVIDTVTVPHEPVDLLVFAHGIPDVQPGRNLAPHLAARCPGDPLAFTICDQGPAAAFTALRLIADYAGTGAGTRALLVVAEQSWVPYPMTAPAPVPDGHAAVALLFEAGPTPVEVRTHRGLPPEAVGAVLAGDLAELTGERSDPVLVVGPALDGAAEDAIEAAEVRRPDPGLPYTGLWARAADTDPGRLLVLADHDPVLGYLCVTAFARTDEKPAGLAGRMSTADRGMTNGREVTGHAY